MCGGRTKTRYMKKIEGSGESAGKKRTDSGPGAERNDRVGNKKGKVEEDDSVDTKCFSMSVSC